MELENFIQTNMIVIKGNEKRGFLKAIKTKLFFIMVTDIKEIELIINKLDLGRLIYIRLDILLEIFLIINFMVRDNFFMVTKKKSLFNYILFKIIRINILEILRWE